MKYSKLSIKRIVFFFLVLCFSHANAENAIYPDSTVISKLKTELKTQSNKEKVQTCLQLSKLYAADSTDLAIKYLYKARTIAARKNLPTINLALSEIYSQQQNLDSMLFLLKEAIDISKKQAENIGLKKSLYYKYAEALYSKSLYRQSNSYYKKAGQLYLQENDSTTFIDILIERGYIYETWGQRDSALLLLGNAIDWASDNNYFEGVARASMVVGNLYHGLDNNLKALEYYQKSLQAAKQINNKRGIAINNLNMGMVYLETGENQKAVKFLNEAIQLLKQTQSYTQLAIAYGDLAIIYSKEGNKNEVYRYLKQALQLQKKYGDKQEIAIGYNVYAECLSRLKLYNESNNYLDSCIAIAKQTGFKLMLQKSFHMYAENCKNLKRYELAYSYIEKSNQVKDSIQSENFQNQLAEFDVKYKTMEKQNEIERLQNKEKLQKANIRNLFIGSIGLFLILITWTYFIIIKRKKENEIAELKLAKLQIESQQLADQLELKNKKLTTHALNMLQKNKLLSSFSETISEIMRVCNGETKEKLTMLKQEIKVSIHSENEWNIFRTYFEQVNESFIKNLDERNKKLSTAEVRLAALLKLNMTNKEIASILNITHQSVKNAQYRLKNKLKIPEDEDLRGFLLKL